MRKLKISKMWILAFFLVVAIAGCGDPDKNAGAGNAGDPLTPPTGSSFTPPTGSGPVCPNNAQITAKFSKAMNPATININTFTVTGPTGTSVTGTVTYNSTTMIASFTPAGSLALNTTYTATITTGAADTFGNPLAAKLVWTFTTTAAACVAPASLVLGSACGFGILGATPVVSSVGPTIVTGDVGISPGASITGFPPGTITGGFHAGDAVAATAQGDLTTAYNNAAAAAGGAVLTADIGGQTLPAGVYRTTSAQPSLGITGNLTLDGGANPNATWIFQIVSTLTTAATNSKIILINSASAHNVFWQVGSSATLGTTTTFAGTIMAQASITMGTGAILNGRALARTGAVTMDSNPVNVPVCP